MQARFFVDAAIVIGATAATVGLVVFAYRSCEVAPIAGVERADVTVQSTKTLLDSPRTEAVCRELLKRDGVDPHSLNAALIRLAILTRKTQPAILCKLIENLPADASDAKVQNLCLLVETQPQESQSEIAASAEALLAARESSSAARQAAYAVWLSVASDPDEVFDRAAHAEDTLLFVTSLPMVQSQERRVRSYDYLKPILKTADSINMMHAAELPASQSMKTLQAAVEVCVQLEGRMSEKAEDLICLLRHAELRRFVVQSLAKIPASRLPQEQLGYVAFEVICFIAEQSADNRRREDTQDARELALRIGERMTPEKQARLSKRLTELFSN